MFEARRSLIRAAFVAAAIGGWGAACSSGSGASGGPADGPDAAVDLTTIKLIYNPWDASQLDAAIAQILLAKIGVVSTLTEMDEFAQFPDIAAGNHHASFEVWPSGHAADITNYVDTGMVEDGGLLGPVGKISWYIPTYLLNTNPELASWQAYSNTANTAPFATPQTAPMGQFTSGDPTWTQYDADIIKNLGLNLVDVVTGSEDSELALLDTVYNQRGSIMMYLWTPHAALAKYDLTAVQLPPYDAAEYANAADGGVACDYPADHLFKLFWPGLKTGSPKVHQLLSNIALTNEDQIQLLAQVDNDGVSIADAAAAWIEANPAIWQSWLPAN
jgi:glycine betaine/proline transport system substrate-binding protein